LKKSVTLADPMTLLNYFVPTAMIGAFLLPLIPLLLSL